MVLRPASRVEAAVAKSDVLCAGDLPPPIFSVGYALLLAHSLGLSGEFGPAVAAYWQRLQARQGFRRGGCGREARRRAAEGRAAAPSACHVAFASTDIHPEHLHCRSGPRQYPGQRLAG